MSSRDEYREEFPALEQRDGASFGEEQTVPLGDVHPPVDPWAAESSYDASAPSEPTVPIVEPSPFSASAAPEHTVPLGDPHGASTTPGHTVPIVEPSPYSTSAAPAHTDSASDPYSPSAAPNHNLPVVDLYPTSENWAGAPAYANGSEYASPAYAQTQQPSGQGQGQSPYPAVIQQPQYQGQWEPQQNPYMQPGPYGMAPVEHPQATTVLVLGAISVGVPVLSFVAWYMGSKAKKEIGRGAPYAYAGNLKTGHILGKVIGILTIVGASLYGVFLIFYLVLMFSLFAI